MSNVEPLSQGRSLLRAGLSPWSSVARGAMGLLAREVQRRIPPADLDERDVEYIRLKP